jgi:carbon monoxide dehydrogenase subunit G
MRIDNSFQVEAPIDAAWRAFLDLERIASSLPGAQVRGVDGGALHGSLTVTVGPVTAHYRGSAHVESVDDANRTAVIVAAGHETGGDGDVAATVKLVLQPVGGGTRLDVDTDLVITGTVAQHEGDELGDAWTSRLAQLVVDLEREALRPDVVDLTQPDGEAAEVAAEAEDAEPDEIVAEAVAATAEPAASPSGNGAAVRRAEPGETVDVEFLDTGATPLARRLAPVAGLVVTVLVLRWLVRRKRRSGL